MDQSFKKYISALLVVSLSAMTVVMVLPTCVYAAALDGNQPAITRHVPDHQILVEEQKPKKNSTWYWWVLAGLVVAGVIVVAASISDGGDGGGDGPVVH